MIDSGEKSIVSVKEAYEFEWEKSNENIFLQNILKGQEDRT